MTQSVIDIEQLQDLLRILADEGYRVVGPTLREGAIVYDDLQGVDDLPRGWTDTQDGGFYRLQRRKDQALFGYAVGPHSWKKFLHPPVVRLWRAKRDNDGFTVTEENDEPPKFAFIGVRSCELHAIAVQDKVFLGGPHVDPIYQARRQNVFIVAVNCGHAAGTCFCVSMQTGPKATFGFDLALTEILEDGRHYFFVEAESEKGKEILAKVGSAEASEGAKRSAEQVVAQTARVWGGKWTPPISKNCFTATMNINVGTMWQGGAFPARTARWSARPVFVLQSKTSMILLASMPSAGVSGTRASISTSRTYTVAASEPPLSHVTVNG